MQFTKSNLEKGYNSNLPNSHVLSPPPIDDFLLLFRHRNSRHRRLVSSPLHPTVFLNKISSLLISELEYAMTIFSVQSTIFIRASVALLSSNGLKRFSSASSFSSNPLYPPPLPKTKKRCFPIVSAVDIGGVTIGRNGSCF